MRMRFLPAASSCRSSSKNWTGCPPWGLPPGGWLSDRWIKPLLINDQREPAMCASDLFQHRKAPALFRLRAPTNVHIKRSRLHDALYFRVVERQIVEMQLEVHVLRFAWLQCDAMEA